MMGVGVAGRVDNRSDHTATIDHREPIEIACLEEVAFGVIHTDPAEFPAVGTPIHNPTHRGNFKSVPDE